MQEDGHGSKRVVGSGAGAVARTVSGADRASGAQALGAAVPEGAAPARRAEEPGASGPAGLPGRQQLHHFLSTSPWSVSPLQEVLFERADRLLGGREAVLLIDDTALVKQGTHSVGVARQYCGELGKRANCQSLVTLTLAREEVPLVIWMRLFLPESWATDAERCQRARISEAERVHRPKWEIALEGLDSVWMPPSQRACASGVWGRMRSTGRRRSFGGHFSSGICSTRWAFCRSRGSIRRTWCLDFPGPGGHRD